MNICEYNEKCPCVDNCDRKIEITTYKDVKKGIRRFTKGFDACDMSKAEIYPSKEWVADKYKNFRGEFR